MRPTGCPFCCATWREERRGLERRGLQEREPSGTLVTDSKRRARHSSVGGRAAVVDCSTGKRSAGFSRRPAVRSSRCCARCGLLARHRACPLVEIAGCAVLARCRLCEQQDRARSSAASTSHSTLRHCDREQTRSDGAARDPRLDAAARGRRSSIASHAPHSNNSSSTIMAAARSSSFRSRSALARLWQHPEQHPEQQRSRACPFDLDAVLARRKQH